MLLSVCIHALGYQPLGCPSRVIALPRPRLALQGSSKVAARSAKERVFPAGPVGRLRRWWRRRPGLPRPVRRRVCRSVRPLDSNPSTSATIIFHQWRHFSVKPLISLQKNFQLFPHREAFPAQITPKSPPNHPAKPAQITPRITLRLPRRCPLRCPRRCPRRCPGVSWWCPRRCPRRCPLSASPAVSLSASPQASPAVSPAASLRLTDTPTLSPMRGIFVPSPSSAFYSVPKATFRPSLGMPPDCVSAANPLFSWGFPRRVTRRGDVGPPPRLPRRL